MAIIYHIGPWQKAQDVMAIYIVPRQHTDEEGKYVYRGAHRGFGIYGNTGSQQNPQGQPAEKVSDIQRLHPLRE